MLFNSIEFAIFLPIIFLIYWFVVNQNLKLQNLFLLISSYVFYGWWDWRFLSLIAFSSLVDYCVGQRLSESNNNNHRKLLLIVSILVNLGFLGFFKYYNFFAQSFADAFTFFGQPIDPNRLNIILPVGISFYTFQTLSYSIDIYRRKLSHTKDIISFFAFVSFFPQLVAGPIERASNLLPQFYAKRTFNYSAAVDGVRQILWGLFKKIVIADNCAFIANQIFDESSLYSGSTLLVGVICFAFQIYGDFSGYSDIAIGTSRLFGFNLMKNFDFPYFSRDIGEFWRRWHISLNTWFRDYLYIPLGGSRGSKILVIRNVFIIFLVSGFWHGANWTFLIWGGLNAFYFLPLIILGKNRHNLDSVAAGRLVPSLVEVLNMTFTFGLTCFAWIFFRAKNLGHAVTIIENIFTPELFQIPEVIPSKLLGLIPLFILIEWSGREDNFAIEKLFLNWKRPWRFAFYTMIAFFIIGLGGAEQKFIYFQF
ncbi:D-alanyl-lipoteichoic acid acyltransferase DltB, MBOAT superfamily [Reichenbachiella faecimaris]|uniref:D-alanyl-lipoteichoic acid acyltransferase DltB, MBOAT superfamily n=1 Tax=Reichenbachiella faecimaris TaxID=692418 RepID=A0A1W2GD12_REIFA|nr:MBOAT family O-acyltransferase [Reichenbachiella faecimaris]SMD34362.1 D-alanyl-lipoteichoic acid acyltransferase DltB, MBOAT superfamily [Reichenbachiella faecimaris]